MAAIAAFALLVLPSAASAHGMGLISSPHAAPDRSALAAVRVAAVGVPPSVSLTGYAPAPGDQGEVNSCAAWATDYSALGYWEDKLGISGGWLAPMYTYSQLVGGHDIGSSITGNLEIARTQGVDNQDDYWQGNYDYADTPTASERTNATHWQLSRYNELTVQTSAGSTVTQQSIETALANGTPVVIGIPVDYSFEMLGSANHGYYAGPTSGSLGLHGVTALGYDSTGLRIENSWGARWGDGGFATLSWSFVNANVFEAVSVGALTYSGLLYTVRPAISGTAVVGETLTTVSGTWSPAATSYAYQWQHSSDGGTSWSPISGATASSYVLTSADIGSLVRVDVIASNGITQGSAASAALGRVSSGAPVNAAKPVISGAARAGQTLTAGTGSWTGAVASFAYQWQLSTDGGTTWSPIAGANGAAYTPTRADVGGELFVAVVASNAHGQSTARSDLTAPVLSGTPPNNSVPVHASTGPPRGAVSIVRRAVAGRTLKFEVTVLRGSGRVHAVATRARVHVRLGRRGRSPRYSFSGRLAPGHWVVTVTQQAGGGWSSNTYRFAVSVRGPR